MKIMKNNKRVTQIYKGGVLIWEMPRATLLVGGIRPGSNVLNITKFPSESSLKIIINGKENIIENNGINYFYSLEKSLQTGDRVEVFCYCEGWRGTSYFSKP